MIRHGQDMTRQDNWTQQENGAWIWTGANDTDGSDTAPTAAPTAAPTPAAAGTTTTTTETVTGSTTANATLVVSDQQVPNIDAAFRVENTSGSFSHFNGIYRKSDMKNTVTACTDLIWTMSNA